MRVWQRSANGLHSCFSVRVFAHLTAMARPLRQQDVIVPVELELPAATPVRGSTLMPLQVLAPPGALAAVESF